MLQTAIKNRLTESETVQIFGMYPLVRCRIYDSIENPDEPVPDKIEGVYFDTPPAVWCEKTTFAPSKVKIVLKSLHHLFPTDIINACRTYDNTGLVAATGKNITVVPEKERPISKVYTETNYSYVFDHETGRISLFNKGMEVSYNANPSLLIQWYRRNSVAIPVYFEEGHWGNGKTPFELGVAEPCLDLLQFELDRVYHKDKEKINLWFFDAKLLDKDLRKLHVVDELIAELKRS